MRSAAPYRFVFAALVGLLLLVGLTHLGKDSPYTYGWGVLYPDKMKSSVIEGLPVNPDALTVVGLTVGYLKPCGVYFAAPNIFIPLHSLFASAFVALTHSYVVGSIALNFFSIAALLAVFVKLSARYRIPASATIVGGALIVFLPWTVCYFGQPLHYTFGVALNCILACAIIERTKTHGPDPWQVGLSIALMRFTYDWYVWAAALGLYFVAFEPFRKKRDYVTMATLAALPSFLWGKYLTSAGGAELSTRALRQQVQPLTDAWHQRLEHPLEHLRELFVLPQVALEVTWRSLSGLLMWPLLLVVVTVLIVKRVPVFRSTWGRFGACVSVIYLLEQCAIATDDWENNPRRALPVVFVFMIATTWAIKEMWGSIRGRVLFVSLAAVCGALAFTDTLLGNAAPAMLGMREYVQGPSKDVLLYSYKNLATVKEMPAMGVENLVPRRDFDPVCGKVVDPDWLKFNGMEVGPREESKLPKEQIPRDFLVAQLLLAASAIAIAWLLVRARIMATGGALLGLAVLGASFVAKYFY